MTTDLNSGTLMKTKKKNSEPSTIKSINEKRLEEIALDFVVNGLTRDEMKQKYNLTEWMYKAIVKNMNLNVKRREYSEKVLDKSIERCSTNQSKIIYKATEILGDHVDKLFKLQKRSGSKILSSTEVRDVMAILQTVGKEHRLDNQKATEIMVGSIKLEFPEGYSPITDNPIEVEAEFTSEEEGTLEEKTDVIPEVEVEVDSDILGSPLG